MSGLYVQIRQSVQIGMGVGGRRSAGVRRVVGSVPIARTSHPSTSWRRRWRCATGVFRPVGVWRERGEVAGCLLGRCPFRRVAAAVRGFRGGGPSACSVLTRHVGAPLVSRSRVVVDRSRFITTFVVRAGRRVRPGRRACRMPGVKGGTPRGFDVVATGAGAAGSRGGDRVAIRAEEVRVFPAGDDVERVGETARRGFGRVRRERARRKGSRVGSAGTPSTGCPRERRRRRRRAEPRAHRFDARPWPRHPPLHPPTESRHEPRGLPDHRALTDVDPSAPSGRCRRTNSPPIRARSAPRRRRLPCPIRPGAAGSDTHPIGVPGTGRRRLSGAKRMEKAHESGVTIRGRVRG